MLRTSPSRVPRVSAIEIARCLSRLGGNVVLDPGDSKSDIRELTHLVLPDAGAFGWNPNVTEFAVGGERD